MCHTPAKKLCKICNNTDVLINIAINFPLINSKKVLFDRINHEENLFENNLVAPKIPKGEKQ